MLVDTTLENADLAVSQIASDNEGGGREAAKTLTELIGGSGKVFVVNVKPGISTTDLRAKGFEEGAKEAGLDYIGQEYSQDDPAKAASIVKSILARTRISRASSPRTCSRRREPRAASGRPASWAR